MAEWEDLGISVKKVQNEKKKRQFQQNYLKSTWWKIFDTMYTHTNNNMAANTQNKAFNGVRQGKWLRKLVADTLLWDLGFYVGFVLPTQVFALAANNDFLDQQSKETCSYLENPKQTLANWGSQWMGAFSASYPNMPSRLLHP